MFGLTNTLRETFGDPDFAAQWPDYDREGLLAGANEATIAKSNPDEICALGRLLVKDPDMTWAAVPAHVWQTIPHLLIIFLNNDVFLDADVRKSMMDLIVTDKAVCVHNYSEAVNLTDAEMTRLETALEGFGIDPTDIDQKEPVRQLRLDRAAAGKDPAAAQRVEQYEQKLEADRVAKAEEIRQEQANDARAKSRAALQNAGYDPDNLPVFSELKPSKPVPPKTGQTMTFEELLISLGIQ